jgi:23S rRNA (guanosine2251-2'-O)-methyltransferase
MPTPPTKQTGELVFGVHPVLELLKNKRRKIISIYTIKPQIKAWAEVEKLLPKYPVQIQYVARDVLHKIAGSMDHQGILAWAQPFPYRKKFFTPEKEKFLVLLDGIQDPRNLGAIIRSAYCTGADGVIIVRKGASSLTATALKASVGLAERMEVYEAASVMQAVQELKKAGYNLYMAAFQGQDATQCSFAKPLCLVIGGEGEGINREIINQGTQVTIPQRIPGISYNASVAAGILLFLISHQQT